MAVRKNAATTRRGIKELTPRQQEAMRQLRFSLARAFSDYVALLDLLGLLVIIDEPKRGKTKKK